VVIILFLPHLECAAGSFLQRFKLPLPLPYLECAAGSFLQRFKLPLTLSVAVLPFAVAFAVVVVVSYVQRLTFDV